MCLATDVLYAGTPYDMGYAQGVLMKDKVQGMMNSAWNFFEIQVVGHSDCSMQSLVVCWIYNYVLCTVRYFNYHKHNCFFQEEAINGTVHFFPAWFLKDVANLG